MALLSVVMFSTAVTWWLWSVEDPALLTVRRDGKTFDVHAVRRTLTNW